MSQTEHDKTTGGGIPAEWQEYLRLTSELASENLLLRAKNERLIVVAERLCAVANEFIQDSQDPGTEALAAVWCAKKELQNG